MSKRDAMEGLDPRELLREGLAGEAARGTELDRDEERQIRDLIARHLPDLEPLELIGRGGMGYVYRAHQRRLDREVALKVLAPALSARPDFAERFAREAKAMARLNHPNIVGVHDYGQEESLCYLVMELVDGTSLRDVIRGGKLAPAEALALVPGICEALQYAHNEGVVHRDVKPENILLDREGRVKIVDFGLAKLVGSPAALVSLTGSQQVLGTLRYMAPEQLDTPLEVDHRADIYSLGVVFYEMLTGEIPMGRFDPPSERAGTDVRLDEIVLRTLQKEPARRYQRARDVRMDVESVGATPAAGLAVGCGPAAGSPPEIADDGRPRLSKLALSSPLLLVLGLFPVLIGLVLLKAFAASRYPEDPWTLPHETGTSEPSFAMGSSLIVMVLPGLVSLASVVLSCVLGWVALDRIRRSWPRLYGVGAATVGAWTIPLLLLGGMVMAVVNLTLVSAGVAVADWVEVVEGILLFVFLVRFLFWYRGHVLEQCRTVSDRSAGPSTSR